MNTWTGKFASALVPRFAYRRKIRMACKSPQETGVEGIGEDEPEFDILRLRCYFYIEPVAVRNTIVNVSLLEYWSSSSPESGSLSLPE